MSATKRILSCLKGVRNIGDGRWIAKCPAHEDRSPSLSIRQSEDRALVYCHAGCELEAIVTALGLSVADLFDESRSEPRSVEVQRKARVAQGLEKWRSRKLTEVCELLRNLDCLAAGSAQLLAFYDETGTGDDEERDETWERLAFAYRKIPALEYDFERLNSKDTALHLEAYREHREAANAA